MMDLLNAISAQHVVGFLIGVVAALLMAKSKKANETRLLILLAIFAFIAAGPYIFGVLFKNDGLAMIFGLFYMTTPVAILFVWPTGIAFLIGLTLTTIAAKIYKSNSQEE